MGKEIFIPHQIGQTPRPDEQECYIDIAIGNQYPGGLLEGVYLGLVYSDSALRASRFTTLARRRYELTEKFNIVILGEILDDMGIQATMKCVAGGFYPITQSGESRFPYDLSGNRDGDIINGINFTVLRRRRNKK